MEVGNSSTWPDNILETHGSFKPLMACVGPWLQSECEPQGYRTCSSYSL